MLESKEPLCKTNCKPLSSFSTWGDVDRGPHKEWYEAALSVSCYMRLALVSSLRA